MFHCIPPTMQPHKFLIRLVSINFFFFFLVHWAFILTTTIPSTGYKTQYILCSHGLVLTETETTDAPSQCPDNLLWRYTALTGALHGYSAHRPAVQRYYLPTILPGDLIPRTRGKPGCHFEVVTCHRSCKIRHIMAEKLLYFLTWPVVSWLSWEPFAMAGGGKEVRGGYKTRRIDLPGGLGGGGQDLW